MGEFYKTKESVEQYVKSAEGFDGKVLIDKFTKHLTSKATVLEIGSGPGKDLEILSKNPDYKVIGSDNSEEFISYLQNKYSIGNFLKLEADTLETDLKFDGIYSNKVLHHLTDEQLISSVNKQAEILNPNGVVCHSFWKGESSEVFKGLFVNYHTIKEVEELFQNEFEILSIELYKEFEADDSILFIGRRS
ncbi:class I SAM-dependent methyltransferase [bacterium]|jgi:2-polyprenyl-3-methyl-5-hydroxy-6-metoxy-1,4-benzoquinol methylase|nr:class I SAM-dependent methyltransferase [Flavobacteriales bacterium]MDA9304032.1 class I SAM-dependent methyltransferase [bacterium]MDA9304040.1 class I SAM-dependent methyltransferase [bacterium]MDB9701856.1 class I SAM-dependent methyltransferase [Flavobacteriales bacterium]